MEELKIYLCGMTVSQREAFARRCGTTYGYIAKCISLKKILREKTCALIERESMGSVKRSVLRPDDWRHIWPELAAADNGSHDQHLAA